MCVDKLCVDKWCVSKLCVNKLRVSKLCVSKLCVSKLCVDKLCVSELCVCESCVGAGGGRSGGSVGGASAGVPNYKQESHTKMWGKTNMILNIFANWNSPRSFLPATLEVPMLANLRHCWPGSSDLVVREGLYDHNVLFFLSVCIINKTGILGHPAAYCGIV